MPAQGIQGWPSGPRSTLDDPKPGLAYITSVSFAAVSSVSVDNCFTSTYDNYRIIYSGLGSTTQDVYLRLRASSVDATAANYNWTNQDNAAATNSTAQTFTILSINGTTLGGAAGDILGPYLAQATVGISMGRRPSTSIRFTAWDHTLATSYDGITLYPSTGTFSGTISIFGYRRAL